MLLLIDNLDSFTYNLAQSFLSLGTCVEVVRCNTTTTEECIQKKPKWIVIGPGPGTPERAILSLDLIEAAAGKIPILGVCLGHQCLVTLYGGNVIRAEKAIHGKTSSIFHDGKGVFLGMVQGFQATRYHSLVAKRETLPSCLEITAETKTGEIMGLRHRTFPIESVQFHPESIATENGSHLFKNFLTLM
ncbi:MAG: aminodeoxychorismate/anthranilate synthase component II [Parachlamydiaceae bacterium]|nr:aminodeoxychorismate/anthranilate synthase component II [Parachlamydiaceae bacterium]